METTMMPNAQSVQRLADLTIGIEVLFETIQASRLRVHRIMAATTTGDLEQIQKICQELLELTEWEEPD